MHDKNVLENLRTLLSPFVMSIDTDPMGEGPTKINIGYTATPPVVDQMKALLAEIPACHTVADAEKVQEKYRDLMYYLDTINRISRKFRGEDVMLVFYLGDAAEKFFTDMAKAIVDLEARTGIHEILAQTMIAAGTPLPEHQERADQVRAIRDGDDAPQTPWEESSWDDEDLRKLEPVIYPTPGCFGVSGFWR